MEDIIAIDKIRDEIIKLPTISILEIVAFENQFYLLPKNPRQLNTCRFSSKYS